MDAESVLISSLYRSALVIETDRFRSWALNKMAAVLQYDAVIWATGANQPGQFKVHDITCAGMSDETAQACTDPSRDGFFAACLAAQGRALQSCQWQKDNAGQPWQAGPAGFDTGLGVHRTRPLSGLVSVLHLYRRGASARFSDAEAQTLERLAFHLDDAGSLSFFVHLGQPPKIPRRKFAAVCDRHGILREAQEKFLELLREHYPDWSGPTLPFDVPDPADGEQRDGRGLHLQSESVGDWLCLRIWAAGPLDSLSDREREVVTATCQGLTLKETARRLGIAPSTASNHLYRAYEKLEVGNREELRSVVKPITFT